MDGWMLCLLVRWMDGRLVCQSVCQMDSWTGQLMNGRLVRWIDEWLFVGGLVGGGYIDVWVDGMSGWTDGWMDGQMVVLLVGWVGRWMLVGYKGRQMGDGQIIYQN